MKYRSIVALLFIAIAVNACDSDNPNEPSQPTTFVFLANLSTANEVPAVTNGESGTGTATITMRVTRDSGGTITAATTDFSVSLAGFPSTTTITIAHIHEAPVGVQGPIVVNTGIASGDTPLSGGAGSIIRPNINTTVDVANKIINNTAGFYFNVHSAANGPGVTRGQMVLSASQ